MPKPAILTDFQFEFLEHFFENEIGRQFFLTGGTALAAFYLEHRYSEDIDLFTLRDMAMELIQPQLTRIASNLGAQSEVAVATPTFRQIFLTRDNESLKIDLVRDIDIQFGKHKHFDSVIVDAFENIGANKVTAIFGRTAVKDFVDLYFMLEAGLQLDELLALAKMKDGGLTEFYLAGMMRQARELNRLPRMIRPLDLDKLKIFYLKLADELLRRAEPPA